MTHNGRTLGVIEQGIVLIFIPLLMLSVDVMAKFTCANEHWSVITMHLDKLYNANKRAYLQLLDRCHCLLCSTKTTIFILLSP
jgi:hypothetical protein